MLEEREQQPNDARCPEDEDFLRTIQRTKALSLVMRIAAACRAIASRTSCSNTKTWKTRTILVCASVFDDEARVHRDAVAKMK